MKNLTAGDVMTQNVRTVGADWPIDRLAEYLTEHAISGAPVVDDEGRLIGVVSLTDIARFNSMPVRDTYEDHHEFYHPAQEILLAREELGGYHVDDQSLVTARDIMTPVIFQLPEAAAITEVAETMMRGRIHRLFVTRDHQVVGVVSAFDLLGAILPMVKEVVGQNQ